jgi:hypothetical protein
VRPGLCGSATAALGDARRLIHESFQSAFADHLDREARTICSPDRHLESREGFAAFLQKRNPNFPSDGVNLPHKEEFLTNVAKRPGLEG